MTLAFPFTGSLTFLLFVAWIPLLLVEDSIETNRYRAGKVLIHSYLAFLIYNIGTTWWIWFADPTGAIMAFLFNSTLMAIAFQCFHFCKRYIGRKEGYLGFIFIWLSFEYLHHIWELSWPWLSFGNAFSITPSLVQWYEYTGILGGTFWILLVNLLILRIINNRFKQKESWNIQTPLFFGLFLLIGIPISISLYIKSSINIKGKPLEVVVTQPNIDPYNEKFGGMELQAQVNRILHLADSVITPNTDLVIAPETALPHLFWEENFKQDFSFAMIAQAMKHWNGPEVLIGASTQHFYEKSRSRASKKIDGGPGYKEYYNTSILIDSELEPHFIHKSKLVLGVEKVPFSNWLPWLEQQSIDLGGASGTLGIEDEPRIFQGPKYSFAPVVCYESIYGEFVSQQCEKGAQAILIITNDGWWRDTPGYKQHLSFASLRAIENRKYVARSANTGTSAIIDLKGQILHTTKWWVPDSFNATIYLNQHETFYMKHGDAIGRSFTFISLLLLLFAFVKKFKPTPAK